MTRAQSTGIPYDSSWRSLITPGDADDFFARHRPASDAALCAELSRLAYCSSPQRRREALARVGFEEGELLHAESTHALLVKRTGEELYALAFRGTESADLRDLVHDLKIAPTRWPAGGWVHRGFAQALRPLERALAAHLERSRARFLVTGHSLGAALATLTFARYPHTVLYTFGGSRVGNAAFAATLNPERVHRFVNCSDIITMVPPWPYRHAGRCHYIDRDGTPTIDPPPGALSRDRCTAQAAHLRRHRWRAGRVALRFLADHAPINYVSAIP